MFARSSVLVCWAERVNDATDGLFSLDDTNLFLSPKEIFWDVLEIFFSNFIMKMYVVCTHYTLLR